MTAMMISKITTANIRFNVFIVFSFIKVRRRQISPPTPGWFRSLGYPVGSRCGGSFFFSALFSPIFLNSFQMAPMILKGKATIHNTNFRI